MMLGVVGFIFHITHSHPSCEEVKYVSNSTFWEAHILVFIEDGKIQIVTNERETPTKCFRINQDETIEMHTCFNGKTPYI